MRTSPWVIAALPSRPPRLSVIRQRAVQLRSILLLARKSFSAQRWDSRRRFALLPPTRVGGSSQKTDVKAGKGLMSPSAAVHCDARESHRAMHHSGSCSSRSLRGPGGPGRPACARVRRKPGQSYINDAVVSCAPGHLYGCSYPARECRLQLDKHARLSASRESLCDAYIRIRICME